MCLTRNYEVSDGADFCETCREWCSAGATLDYYDLCSTAPRGGTGVFHAGTFEPEA